MRAGTVGTQVRPSVTAASDTHAPKHACLRRFSPGSLGAGFIRKRQAAWGIAVAHVRSWAVIHTYVT